MQICFGLKDRCDIVYFMSDIAEYILPPNNQFDILKNVHLWNLITFPPLLLKQLKRKEASGKFSPYKDRKEGINNEVSKPPSLSIKQHATCCLQCTSPPAIPQTVAEEVLTMEGKQCQLEYQSCEFNKGTMTDLPACNGILKSTVFPSD